MKRKKLESHFKQIFETAKQISLKSFLLSDLFHFEEEEEIETKVCKIE